MKLTDLMKKVGGFGTHTRIILVEHSKTIADIDDLQVTNEFNESKFQKFAGYKVESFTVGNNSMTINVS